MMLQARGFTLIEILVALALLGILSVLGWRGIDGMLRAEERVRSTTTHWQTIARTVERLQFDLAQPSLHSTWRNGRADAVMTGVASPELSGLMFVRRPLASEQNEQRLAYRLRQERLELLLWPDLDGPAASDPVAALSAAAPPTAKIYPLLENVKAFELRYLDAAKAWQDHWPQGGPQDDPFALPRAIQLRLLLADGTDITRLFALP